MRLVKLMICASVLLMVVSTAANVQAAAPAAFETDAIQVDDGETVEKLIIRAAEDRDPNSSLYKVIYGHIRKTAPGLGEDKANWMTDVILDKSARYGVNPLLVAALFTQESGFRMSALSRTGAVGIAQLQPGTADYLGVDIYDPAGNIEGGVRYLAEQLYNFKSAGIRATQYAVAAYNAGPGAVKKYGGCPPYAETRRHVACVAAIFHRLVREMLVLDAAAAENY